MSSHTSPEYSRWYNQTHQEQIKAYGIKWRATNKDKISINQKIWREQNKEIKALSSKAHSLRKKYLVSLEEFNKMRETQNYKCAICKIHETQLIRGLCVDHDHQTKLVRSLLCRRCNSILGFCDENSETLFNAIQYLKNWKEAKGK